MIETVGRIALWLLAAAMIGYGLINLVFRSDLKRADLLTRGDERRSLLGAAAGLALVALLLTGCVTSPPVYGDVPECERLIPDSLKADVPGVPIPESEEAEAWMNAFVGQTGQLDKANERPDAIDHIYRTCLELHRDALNRAKRGWLARIFS